MKKTSQYLKAIGIIGIFLTVWGISFMSMPRMALASAQLDYSTSTTIITRNYSGIYQEIGNLGIISSIIIKVSGDIPNVSLFCAPSKMNYTYPPLGDYSGCGFTDSSSYSSLGNNFYKFNFSNVDTSSNYWYIRVIDDNDSSDLVIYGSSISIDNFVNYRAIFYDRYNSFSTSSKLNDIYFVINENYDPFDDYSTRIISLSPEDNSSFPSSSSTSMTFSLEAYINENDIGNTFFSDHITIYLRNIDQNVLLLGALSPSDIVLLDQDIETGGYFSFSTTTIVLGEGNYRINAKLSNGIFDRNIFDELSHQFIVGNETFIGSISQNTYSNVNGLYASTTATSTNSLAESCGLFSSSSSVLNCLAFLFTPDGKLIQDSLNTFKELASTHFPLGYITDIITIFNASNTVALPRLAVPIPEGFPGAGLEIDLSPWGHLLGNGSYLSTATSSVATGSKTLMGMFMPIWNTFIYVLLAFYILSRIFGSSFNYDHNGIKRGIEATPYSREYNKKR